MCRPCHSTVSCSIRSCALACLFTMGYALMLPGYMCLSPCFDYSSDGGPGRCKHTLTGPVASPGCSRDTSMNPFFL